MAGTQRTRTGGVVCLAQDGDDILTSDPGDLLDLVRTAGVHGELIPVNAGRRAVGSGMYACRRPRNTRSPSSRPSRAFGGSPRWTRSGVPTQMPSRSSRVSVGSHVP